MGVFETKTVNTDKLPADVPNAAESAADHADGTIYKSESGQRFRLRHARWSPVLPRKAKGVKAGTAAPTK